MYAQGNLKMSFEKKTMDEWKDGTYNHLMMKSYGNAIVVARLTFDTTPADLASFFRNFHLQGNGMTMLEDVGAHERTSPVGTCVR